MPKSTKHAMEWSVGLTILAVMGIIIGLIWTKPLIIMLLLLPTVIYEVYRTEGKSTKWASWALVGIFFHEIVLIVFKINYNLADLLGRDQQYIGEYLVPLGDIKIVAPIIIAVLSILLLTKTWGKYTKYLAAVIIVGSFSVIYTLDPVIFKEMIKIAIDKFLDEIPS